MREDGELLVLGDLAAASVERDDAGDVAMCYTEEMEDMMDKVNNPAHLSSIRAHFDELLALGGGQETDAGIWRYLDRHAPACLEPAELKRRRCPIKLPAFQACACKTSFNTMDTLRRFVQHCANMGGRTEANQHLQSEHGRECRSVWKSNLQPDFNVRVIERIAPDSSAVLRELHESNRFVQKSAKSTSI